VAKHSSALINIQHNTNEYYFDFDFNSICGLLCYTNLMCIKPPNPMSELLVTEQQC